MERKSKVARQLFGSDFIGHKELSTIGIHVPYSFIPYSEHELKKYVGDYILILAGRFNLLNLKKMFSENISNPLYSPCFYNQDWYENQEFVKTPMEHRWYLVKKNGFNYGCSPENIKEELPLAAMCTYTFFTYFLLTRHILWAREYIWCRDKDNSHDRIYVGGYFINKIGFEIHRHLAIKKNYGTINFK
jgi:hypothetical protein